MAARRKRSRAMTYKEMQRREKQDAWRALMKSEGEWVVVDQNVAHTFKANDETTGVFGFVAAANEKITVYNVDILCTIRIDAVAAVFGEVIQGYLCSFVQKPGDTIAEWFDGTGPLTIPRGAAYNYQKRYASYRNVSFVVPNSVNAATGRSVLTFPLSELIKGHRMTLKPNEAFRIILALDRASAADVGVSIVMNGRHRIIRENIA